jgi:predicted TIM-barrel fold metal-dependent hydrolase
MASPTSQDFASGALVRNGRYVGPVFDGDTHVQEGGLDFFKDYLPKALHQDWLPAEKIGPTGEFGLHLGDRILRNAEANPDGLVPPPGKLREWLKAVAEGKSNVTGWTKPTDYMTDRNARLAKMDEFGVEAALVFPGMFIATFGELGENPESNAVLSAYNRWLRDKWGYAYQERIYGVPVLSLFDMETSVREAEQLIKDGARAVCMPMGPAQGRSPADPMFDPIWSRLNEAEVAITFHVAEAQFMHPLIRAWGEEPLQARRTGQTAWQWMFCYSELPIQMMLANIVYHNLFERFPKLRIASVENGADWLPQMLKKMDKMRGMARNGYWPCGQLKERPSAIFKRHCFVVAYPEDDVAGIVEKIGTSDCILMGSDYPHAEGVPEPRDFYTEALQGVNDSDVRAIMFDNARRLIPRRG